MLLDDILVCLLLVMGCTIGKEDLEAGKFGVDGSPYSTNASTVPITTSQTNTEKSLIENINPSPDLSSNQNDIIDAIKQPKYKTKIDSRVTSKYEIKALIGKGSFSDVLRVDCKVTKQPFAVKILKVRNEQEEDLLNAELSVLRSFSHRYIIHLEEVIMSKECTYLIMELATGGELYDRIKSRGHLDETYSCNVTQMILEGLNYLHSYGITHRDLKPENLLFYHPGRDSKILITDFGFSKVRNHSLDFSMTTWCGTPEYIAPELLRKVPYSSKVDLWALGAIVFVMLSGHLPFSAETTPKLFKQIMECNYSFTKEIWSTVSLSAKDFIKQLLVVDPMERLDANAASAHPWLKSQPPLHKRNSDAKITQRRLQTRHRRSARLESTNVMKHGKFDDDSSSVMSDSTWTNYMKTKASPLYKRQKTSDSNMILPFTGEFQGNFITKDKILDDQESTLTPSIIDSALATGDSNSQKSSQCGVLQMYYYTKMMSAETENDKERATKEYTDYMQFNELKLPMMLPLISGKQHVLNSSTGSGVVLPKVGSLKERKISVHDQFENIDEESEDEIDNLTKLDRIYASQGNTANSFVSSGSLKSTHIPVEISNASYIEKVGVWLNDSDDKSNKDGKFTFTEGKYKISTSDMDSLLSNRRTMSQKSNLTTSDHSQASFNRVLLPPQQKKKISELNPTQSFISNATSTTELIPSSVKSDISNGFVKETIINIPNGTGTFNTTSLYMV